MKYNFFIDPTYLRTIVDGLSSGSVQKDNALSLPQGLIGVYEEALPSLNNVIDRNRFMVFFGTWALLKKEVSSDFICKLLNGWNVEDVTVYISLFSKWFNSPVSGLFSLYHERLRTFILQKMDDDQFSSINQRIIEHCNSSLKSQSGDEWERYALEYLSAHFLIDAMKSKDQGAIFKSLAYNTSYWNRQIEVSKGFDWSKRMLNEMMLWASKYDDDEVIECALNKVDLHHMEQNDAPRIIELVAQNDIDTALARIESFGENDKEGLQRKFILYMLCLMELTLLDSKDKPIRRDAIEKLLKHLDENMPVNHSVLNWNEFLSDHLVFKIIYVWKPMGIDYSIIIKRTSDFRLNWLSDIGIKNLFELEILVRSITQLSNTDNQFYRLSSVIDTLHSIGKSSWIEKMIPLLDEESMFEKCLINIPYPSFYKGGEQIINNLLPRLKKNVNKINLLANYFSSLSPIEKESCSKSILDLLLNINLANQDKEYIIFKAYMVMTDISYSVENMTNALRYFSEAKVSLFNLKESKRRESAINQIIPLICKLDNPGYALDLAQQIKNDIIYIDALTSIVNHYTELNDFDSAINTASACRSPFLSGSLMVKVTEKLLKSGRIDEAVLMTQQKIPLESQPNIQITLVKGLCEQKDYERALLIVDQIWSKYDRDLAYQLLSVRMASEQKMDVANAYLKKIQDTSIRTDTLFKMYMQCEVSVRTNESASLWGEMMNELKSVLTLDTMRLQAKKIIDVLSTENDLTRIQALLYVILNKQTGQNALLPSIESSIHSMIPEIVKIGNLEKAIQLINGNYKGIEKDIKLYGVLQNLIEMKNEEGMLSVGQLFNSNEYKLFSASLIAGYYANKDDLYAKITALSYLSDAIELVEHIMKPSGFLIESRFVQLKVAETMLPVLVKMEYWDDAIGIIEKITLPNDRFSKMLFFIRLLIKNDQEELTNDILDKLINDIRGIELIKRLEILSELAVMLSVKTHSTRGKDLILEVFNEYKKLVESQKKHKINFNIISGITTVLGHNFMRDFCEKSFHSSNKDKIVGFLAIDCLKMADFAGMPRYLNLISGKAVYLATITKIVELCQSNDHKEEYRSYMDLSLRLFQELETQNFTDSILNHLLSTACKAYDFRVIDSILLMNKSASDQAKLINTLGEHLSNDIIFCNDDYFKRLVHPLLGEAYRAAVIQGMSIKHMNQDLLISLLKLNSFSAEQLEYLLIFRYQADIH